MDIRDLSKSEFYMLIDGLNFYMDMVHDGKKERACKKLQGKLFREYKREKKYENGEKLNI